MADMKIAMTLTMADLASPEIQKFKANIAQLEDYLKGLGDSFKLAIGGAADLGKATADAAGGITALSRASSGATRSTGRLGEALGVIQDALSGMSAKLAEVADSMAAMATSTADLSAASKGAAAGIAAMGDAAGAADAKMAGMHGTMKGLVELYGAFKIGEGLKKSAEAASSYQQEAAQMRLMGIPAAARANMLTQASQLQKLPGVSKLASLEAALGGYAAVPGAGPAQTQIRQALMPEAMKAAMVLKSSFGDTTPIGTIVRNILGSVEMMGKLENIPQALQGIREVLQIAEGSHGKITPINLETALRNTAYGESLRYSKQGLFTVEALHEQFKAAGGAGGSGGNTKAGTIAGMIAAMQMGGRMQKIQALMLEQLGLLNPSDVLKIRGTSTVYTRPGVLPHSAEGLKNPIQWVHDVLDPHIAALIHKQNPGLTGAAFTSREMDWAAAYAKASGGGNVGTGIVLTQEPGQWARLMNTRAQMERAATPGKGVHILQGTLAFKQKEMMAKLETVAVEIGTALLPALQMLATWVTNAAHAVSTLNTAFPVFTKIEAWAGALAALLLGIKGVEWLLGIKDAFLAIKAVKLGGVALQWAADFTGLGGQILGAGMAAEGVAGSLGGLGEVLVGLAGPIGLAIAAIAGFGYAAYSFRHQLESGWAQFKHYLHPHAYPLPAKTSAHIPLGLMPNATHWGGVPNHALLNEQAHMAAMTAAAANAAGLGYSGPVTAAGLAKAAALHHKTATTAQHVTSAGQNKLASAFAHKVAIGERYAAKLNHIADSVHIAWLGITNPLNAKIAAARSKYSGISGELLAGGHITAAKEAMQVGHHKVLQYQYQGAMQHLSALKGNLHQTLTNTAALVTTGSLTKMQAAQQTIQEQKAAAPAMIQAANAAIKYAKALGDPKLVQALQIQRTHLQAMGSQLGYYAAKVKNITQNSLTGLFQNMMHGQKTWGQMFASFFQSIGKSLENTLAQSISQAITKSLFTKKSGGAINSIFSLFGGLGSAVAGGSSHTFSGAGILGAGAFSGGSSSGGSSIMSSVGGWVKAITSIASMFGFASGADYIPNNMVAQIHKGEMIIPAAGASLIRSGQASIGGGAGGHTLNLTVHALDSQSVMGALHSVKAEATQLFMNTAQHLNYNGGG